MAERAGFWRRALAFVLDGLIVAVALELVAFVAFPLSNGHIQASLGFQHTTCRRLAEAPPEFEVPPDFGANVVVSCRVGLFGMETARTTAIGRETREGNTTTSVWLAFMVDEDGKPIHGFSLNLLVLPLVIAMRWWTDRHGGSPGRRVTRMSVANAREDAASPSRSAITRRSIAFLLPVIPAELFAAYQIAFVSFASFQSRSFFFAWIGTGIVALTATLWAIGEIVRREDAFYDRFAGTTVRKKVGSAPAV